MKIRLTLLVCCLLIASSITAQNNTIEYTYDAFNRLKQTSDGTNTTVYTYDELGNRTQESISVTLLVTEHEIMELKIYPNPTPSMVSITAKNTIDKVMIYDISGKLLKEQQNTKNATEIDISNFSVGLYHFVIYSQGIKQSLKVLKK